MLIFNTSNISTDVFGCIDGTHIAIPGPLNDNSYYNRKGYHSVVLQGICNSDLKFMNIFCGWPGSAHDARIWKSSNVYKLIEEDSTKLLPKNKYLIGDCAYPLKPYLMVPFKDNGYLNERQHRFNARLSSSRIVIEQAFGRLKGLFRRLKYVNVLNLKNIKYIITAACVLHNISINDNTSYTEQEIAQEDNQEYLINNDIEENTDGKEIRNTIMRTL